MEAVTTINYGLVTQLYVTRDRLLTLVLSLAHCWPCDLNSIRLSQSLLLMLAFVSFRYLWLPLAPAAPRLPLPHSPALPPPPPPVPSAPRRPGVTSGLSRQASNINEPCKERKASKEIELPKLSLIQHSATVTHTKERKDCLVLFSRRPAINSD